MIQKEETEKLTLSVNQAAALLNLSRASTYEGCHTGAIPCIRIGKRILIPRSALEKMLAEAGTRPAVPVG